MNNTVTFIGVDECPQNYIRCGTTLNLTMAVFGTSWNFSNHSVSHLQAVGYDGGSSHCREGRGNQFWDFTFAMELIRRQSWCWAPELRCGGHISRGSAPDYPNSTNHTTLPSHTKHLELEENAMRKIEQRRKKCGMRKSGGKLVGDTLSRAGRPAANSRVGPGQQSLQCQLRSGLAHWLRRRTAGANYNKSFC